MWKNALDEFIEPYVNDKDVLLILLVGSYAVNNNNKYSDIDVLIVLKDNANYQERGNKLVNNYLVEYFINPKYKILEYIEKEKDNFGGPMADMIINGKLLLNNDKKVYKELFDIAKYYKNLKHDKDQLKYYRAWCMYDEYKAAKYHNDMQYFLCLNNLINAYLYNNNYGIRPAEKYEKIFKDEEYCKMAKIDIGNNDYFKKLVIKCFNKKNDKNIDNLYKFVMDDGNFDINNFKHRRELI